MNLEVQYNNTWLELVLLLILSIVFINLLLVLYRAISKTKSNINAYKTIKKNLNRFIIIIEPILIILNLIVFVRISPINNGLVILILGIFLFNHIRNYLNGRFIIIQDKIKVGETISYEGLIARINKTGKFGIYANDKENLTYISYDKLLKNGFSIVGKKETDVVFKAIVSKEKTIVFTQFKEELIDYLFEVPYIEAKSRPEITATDNPEEVVLKVILKQNKNAEMLIELFKDSGYNIIKVIK